MTKRMLIDASHAEETRVAVLDGSRLEEFDLEAAHRLPLKGNIYLAKVVRVEPSLQAAFVEYGGNRHGFLAFSEIHPDYYQIPVADRQKLVELQEAEAREAAEEEERAEARAAERRARKAAIAEQRRTVEVGLEAALAAEAAEPVAPELPAEAAPAAETTADAAAGVESVEQDMAPPEVIGEAPAAEAAPSDEEEDDEGPSEDPSRRVPPKFLRNYKIQEVIRRRQILLIQVVKEERGGKGAALTTYISLAGRYSVLMPNSPRGGGVSRKITSISDRRRLREAIDELDMPNGMSLIVRTAGAQRPKPEIKRDCEYLLRLWDNIRERTLQSIAPALIYEEADLIKRSIRDGYARDVEEIVVDGEEAYQQAREFMRMLMPDNARKIQAYREGPMPLFARFGVEQQLDAMHSPTVQLKSGGYLVINQTEALVAIDVNSGRATRERNIEDTAYRTNLEAADEIARQLRLRDLAGLIVVDFIDMESSKHDTAVERRLKDALRNDRARIQVGRISHFGLLEMSRQRLRPSLIEQTFVTCEHCAGRGLVRSPESAAIHVLRAIEEEGAKRRAAEILVHVRPEIAMYLLNRKRERLSQIEERFGMTVQFGVDDTLTGATLLRIERLRATETRPLEDRPASAVRMDYAPEPVAEEVLPEEVAEETEAAVETTAEERAESEAEGRRRRRRRRRRGRDDRGPSEGAEASGTEDTQAEEGEESQDSAEEDEAEEASAAEAAPDDSFGEDGPRRRRRGRRGGRRRSEEGADTEAQAGEPAPETEVAAAPVVTAAPERPRPAPRPEPRPTWQGPTPADPFANSVDPIMAAMEAAELAAEQAASRPVTPAPAPVPAPVTAPAPVVEAPAPVAKAPVAAPAAVESASAEPLVAPPVQPKVLAVTESAVPASAPAPVVAPLPPAAAPLEEAEAVSATLVQPKVISASDTAPKRGGWWRK